MTLLPMRCWHSYVGSHERFVADMLTAEDATVTEKRRNPKVPELKPHRAPIRPRIASRPQHAALRIAPDNLPSPKRRPVISAHHGLDRMPHVPQFLNNFRRNSFFQTQQPGRRRRLDLESHAIQRLLRPP